MFCASFLSYNSTSEVKLKKLLVLLLLLLLSFSLFSSVSPISERLGEIATDIKPGTIESLVYSAMKKDYDDKWLERYAFSPYSFAVSYSSILSSLLPIENCLISTFKNDEISVMDQKSGRTLTLIIKEGKIIALLEK